MEQVVPISIHPAVSGRGVCCVGSRCCASRGVKQVGRLSRPVMWVCQRLLLRKEGVGGVDDQLSRERRKKNYQDEPGTLCGP